MCNKYVQVLDRKRFRHQGMKWCYKCFQTSWAFVFSLSKWKLGFEFTFGMSSSKGKRTHSIFLWYLQVPGILPSTLTLLPPWDRLSEMSLLLLKWDQDYCSVKLILFCLLPERVFLPAPKRSSCLFHLMLFLANTHIPTFWPGHYPCQPFVGQWSISRMNLMSVLVLLCLLPPWAKLSPDSYCPHGFNLELAI